MRALCSSVDSGVVLGAIGPGCEQITPSQYRIIYDALRGTGFFNLHDLEFFHEHIQHDDYHAIGITEAIGRWVALHGDASVRLGRDQALIFERIFWDGLLPIIQQ
jgi:hypothetical protein